MTRFDNMKVNMTGKNMELRFESDFICHRIPVHHREKEYL